MQYCCYDDLFVFKISAMISDPVKMTKLNVCLAPLPENK